MLTKPKVKKEKMLEALQKEDKQATLDTVIDDKRLKGSKKVNASN
jgi:hypothetical protein